MCGITGFLCSTSSNKKEDEVIVRQMTTTLNHRGPDEQAIYMEDDVALGHTRLIVIDPKGGKQPMSKQHGGQSYTIVSNGELYNTEEVRAKLLEKGHTFGTYSDTEVLLTAYIEWGEHAVDHLNGIFAFAIYSSNSKTLYLARDRLGVKPLYYAFFPDENLFVFGSECKAILKHPLVKPLVNMDGIRHLLTSPSKFPHKTLFRDILAVKPGWALTITTENAELKKKEVRYWKLVAAPHVDNLEETVVKVRELLQAAVERQLVSDVPLGSLLSGGIDSSSIAAFAFQKQKSKGIDLPTFSVNFVDNEKNFKADLLFPSLDGPYIKKMVEHFKFNHKDFEMTVDQQIELLRQAMIARDSPGMGSIDSSMLWLFKNVKKDVVVALSGECSDELFGGYLWYHIPQLVNQKNFPWTFAGKSIPTLLKEDLQMDDFMRKMYEEILNDVPKLEGEDPTEAHMRALVYMNIYEFMQALLERKDAMSMQSGLEVRVPFADHELVQYAYNIPWSMKSVDGVPKGILKRAMRGLLPDEIVDRPKCPYPISHDPQALTSVAVCLTEAIKGGSPIFQVFDEQKLRDFLSEVTKRNGGFQICYEIELLLQIHLWMCEYNVQIVHS